MQLVLGCGACTGRWWSGVGSDGEGPSTEWRHGRHGYKASGSWCLWSGGWARRALQRVGTSALRAVPQASPWSAAASS
eukprot:1149392-Pelagomonas_calceolata.AAC.1